LVGQIGVGFANPNVSAGDSVIRVQEIIEESVTFPEAEKLTQTISQSVTVNIT